MRKLIVKTIITLAIFGSWAGTAYYREQNKLHEQRIENIQSLIGQLSSQFKYFCDKGTNNENHND